MDVARRVWRALPAVCLALAAFGPACGQTSGAAKAAPAQASPASDQAQDESDATTLSGLTVTAKKPAYSQLYGAVVGDIEPEIEFSPSDIQSFGVSTVTELLNELAPETRSDRGRGGESPVVLLNGRRISSFSEVQNIPTEAILRVDILPEEVSLKYGYSANQRVVNIVLRRYFHVTTGEIQGGGPTEGGEETGQAEADLFHVRRDSRLNLDLKYQDATGITDAARGITEPSPPSAGGSAGASNAADLGDDRSLSPATQTLAANAVWAHPIPWGVNATVNASLGGSASDSLQGLPALGPAEPLHQYIDGWTAHLGSTLNKDLGDWRLSLTDAYDHADTQTDTDLGLSPGPPASGPGQSRPQQHARVISDAGNIQVLANGPLIKLPAGALYVSAKAGDTQSALGSTSFGQAALQAVRLSRNDGAGQINIDLPLASRRNGFLPFAGELSINGNAAVDQLSDFGTLTTTGFGVSWTPIEGYNLIVSHTHDEAAPTIQQLGDPVVATPGVRVFDYETGQTVEVTQISGGNRALTRDSRNVMKIGLTLKPFSSQEFTLTANYIRSQIDNPIETFPVASAAIQSAFPTRFIRDAQGVLIEEDLRPVNFAQASRSELRWGVNYSRPIGKQPPPRQFRRAFTGPDGRPVRRRPDGSSAPGGSGSDTQAAGGAGGGAGPSAAGEARNPGGGFYGGGGGGRGRFGGGGPTPGGRLQLAIYHTIYFTDSMLVRPGGPVLDLLNGAPATATGGQYHNEIEAQLGVTLNGFGARLSADWRQATFEQGAPASPTGNLFFSDLTTVNFRLWDTLGQQPAVTRRFPWLRGARISLAINNLLDERVQVRDAAGATPLIYQPGYIDPAGRTITLSLRKLFY